MEIRGIVELQRRYFGSGVTVDLQGRLDALDRLHEMILKYETRSMRRCTWIWENQIRILYV